jgi:hypothetical protein
MKRTIFMILAILVPLVSTLAQSAPLDSEWIAFEQTDPVTDVKILFLLLLADSNTIYYNQDSALVIRASLSTVEIYVNWQKYIGRDANDLGLNGKYITYRFGDNPAETSFWTNSTDKKASFYLGFNQEFLRKMAETNKFIVRCTPSDDNTITLFFNTTGLDYYLRKYQKYFPWYSSAQNVQ